jgi:NOL1/NOP2/fmu family ribosome biogenesis protein
LQDAAPLVRIGGHLIYSTCTYNPAENEAQLAALIEDGQWEQVAVAHAAAWGLHEVGAGYACLPHRCRGEGFFFGVLRRVDSSAAESGKGRYKARTSGLSRVKHSVQGWLHAPEQWQVYSNEQGQTYAMPLACAADWQIVNAALTRKGLALYLGEWKRDQLQPAQALALSLYRDAELPTCNLDREQALRYLRRESLEAPDHAPLGWALMSFDGHPLGWGKILPNRINNYLPQEWRIRHL